MTAAFTRPRAPRWTDVRVSVARVTTTTARTVRVVVPLALVQAALAACYAGVVVVLLPRQVALLDAASKVENLALVSTVSFAFTVAAQPVIGALSDRTRSRFGPRVPWLVGSALVASVALLALGRASSLLLLGALWVVAQVALNGVDVAAAAVVPDEVPPPRRGRTLAALGAASVAGAAVAVTRIGAAHDGTVGAYAALGVAVLVATAVFVVVAGVARPRTRAAAPRPWRRLLADPRREPAFARVFASRAWFVLAYQLVYTYQLYVLTDHVGLPDARASVVLGTLTAVTLVAVLVGAAVTGLGSDRLGRRTPFLVGACALLAVAVAVPLVWPTVAGMTVFAVLKGLASGAHLAAATAFVTEVLPADGTSPATDLGVFNVATNVPQALAPALAGLLVTHAGGYPALFVAAGVVAVLALVASRRAGRVAGTPTPQRVAA